MCRLSLWRRSSLFGLWRNERRKTKSKKKTYTENTESTEDTAKRRQAGMPVLLQIEGAGVGYPGFAGIAALDAADAEELFAAAFEVGFDGFNVGRGHDK